MPLQATTTEQEPNMTHHPDTLTLAEAYDIVNGAISAGRQRTDLAWLLINADLDNQWRDLATTTA